MKFVCVFACIWFSPTIGFSVNYCWILTFSTLNFYFKSLKMIYMPISFLFFSTCILCMSIVNVYSFSATLWSCVNVMIPKFLVCVIVSEKNEVLFKMGHGSWTILWWEDYGWYRFRRVYFIILHLRISCNLQSSINWNRDFICQPLLIW